MKARDLLWEDVDNVGKPKNNPISLAKLKPDTLEPGSKQNIRITGSTEKLFKKISEDCAEYIRVVQETNQFLLRGGTGPDAFLGRSWLARKPKDSNKEASQLFDDMLRKSGMTALRGNSIFATTDGWLAEQFGNNVYLIFPLDGKSSFTYTNKHDVTLVFPEDVGVDQNKTNIYRAKVAEWIKQFQTTDLYNSLHNHPKEILQSLETMARITTITHIARQLQWVQDSNSAIVIPDELLNPNIRDYMSHEAFVDKYQPTNTNLAVAMEDKLEVYVHGLYYALNREKYGGLAYEYWELD